MNLKNRRTYARKRGYLGDRTNQGVGGNEGASNQGSDVDEAGTDDQHFSGIDNQCDSDDQGGSDISGDRASDESEPFGDGIYGSENE